MLLAIDVSNTNTKLGLFEGERLVVSFRIATDHARTGDELGVLCTALFQRAGIELSQVDGIAVSNVVPPLQRTFEEMARRFFGQVAFFVEPGVKTGMAVLFENPAEVGADRIVNAVAAHRLVGGPVVVVDFGTATTFDVISTNGDYLGGVIAPGMLISAEALFQRAARLPLVSVVKPPTVIGRTTVTCMQAGLFHGYVGLVEGLLMRIEGELGAAPHVIATGGHADILSREIPRIQRVEPSLTLLGLRLIYELNHGAAAGLNTDHNPTGDSSSST